VPDTFDTKTFDTSLAPCADFYGYVNKKWLAANPIPADRASWGSFNSLLDRNLDTLHQILEDAAADKSAPPESIKHKVGNFYRTGMDVSRIEHDAAHPLESPLARIADVKDAPSLLVEIATLQKSGIPCDGGGFCVLSPGFRFRVAPDAKDSEHEIAGLAQGGLGLPDRDYYLKEDEKSVEIRAKYVAHVGRMLQLIGESADQSAADAKAIMDLETRLATASATRVEQRDPDANYHKMSLKELDALTPGLSFAPYFASLGIPDPGPINVSQPKFFTAFAKLTTDVPMATWRAYLRWHLTSAAASKLSKRFVDESFAMSAVLSGTTEQQPRWRRVLQQADRSIGEAVGELYVEKAFTPESKARMQEMVKNLKAALRDRLLAIDWIGEDTRKQALAKLDAIGVKIGYPDKWRDYSTLPVNRDSYLGNVMQAGAFEFQRNLRKLGQKPDHAEWNMTPPTVNAQYSPSNNDIMFPAGILQPPFFDPNADDAVNYGGIGAVIGHELTHGFDDQGRKFDAAGNLKNWWTAEDEKNFTARASVVEKQFSGYTVLPNLNVNGKLTLGENLADLGGIKIAYVALQKALAGKPHQEIDGFTPEQRFFLSYARLWRTNMRPEALRNQVLTNPHSPGNLRVIGPLSNSTEFMTAFSCKPGDPTVRPTDQQVRIW
ncbi:MAG TPA: M13 family metallopeptidase, partial [Thermoanaerobaculia bacterium]